MRSRRLGDALCSGRFPLTNVLNSSSGSVSNPVVPVPASVPAFLFVAFVSTASRFTSLIILSGKFSNITMSNFLVFAANGHRNFRFGVEILGVVGTHDSDEVSLSGVLVDIDFWSVNKLYRWYLLHERSQYIWCYIIFYVFVHTGCVCTRLSGWLSYAGCF